MRYSYEECQELKNKLLGSTVICQGHKATVDKLHYFDCGIDSGVDYIDTEFYDTNGKIHSWKSMLDGGKVIWKDGTETVYKTVEVKI